MCFHSNLGFFCLYLIGEDGDGKLIFGKFELISDPGAADYAEYLKEMRKWL